MDDWEFPALRLDSPSLGVLGRAQGLWAVWSADSQAEGEASLPPSELRSAAARSGLYLHGLVQGRAGHPGHGAPKAAVQICDWERVLGPDMSRGKDPGRVCLQHTEHTAAVRPCGEPPPAPKNGMPQELLLPAPRDLWPRPTCRGSRPAPGSPCPQTQNGCHPL